MQDRRKQQRYPLWKNFQPNIPESREPGWILWHRGELTSGKLSEVTCITIAPQTHYFSLKRARKEINSKISWDDEQMWKKFLEIM